MKPEYIFESSWEVCNMVGGIYTVLSTRAATLKNLVGDKLIFIGPDVWSENNKCPYFEEDLSMYSDWIRYTNENFNLPIRCGRWNIPGSPIAILVDFKSLMQVKNNIYGEIWTQFGVNSLEAHGDYDESSMFGYASGMIIDSFCHYFKIAESDNIIAHFNEWMTTFGIYYVKKHLPKVATLFTTHATSIGRSIAGNNKPLYDYLEEYNGDQMAHELNMVSKHSTEKIAAHITDCFTTVSEITANECKQLLDKEPDIITLNGFEDRFVPQASTFLQKRAEAKECLSHVAETLLGYHLSEDALFICTSGRYEYKNKGIDVFLSALKKIQELNSAKKEIVVFIMVPAHIKGERADLSKALNEKTTLYTNNRYTTHELFDFHNDQVIRAIQWFHFKNEHNDPIKVIFIPSYLNGFDGILNKKYYDLLIGMDLTVFASYYEPWGYTPLESIAFSIPTIATDLSGFGQWVSHKSQDIDCGVGIVHRSDYNYHDTEINIAEMIIKYSQFSEEEILIIRQKASIQAEKALWKHFIEYYLDAYSFAFQKRDNRMHK